MTGPDGRRPGDARAQAVLRRFAAAFGAHGLPVPVDAIALDLLGLYVCELDDLGASGVLVPAERRVYLDAGECRESPGRRRFTLAHEIGHWVCQCREGRSAAPAQILCRDDELGPPVVHRLERAGRRAWPARDGEGRPLSDHSGVMVELLPAPNGTGRS